MAISVLHTTSVLTTSVTIPATTAGSCLVVCVMSFQTSGAGAATVSGITLGGSADHFASAVAGHGSSGAQFSDAFIWVDPNCAAGQTAVAVSGSGLSVASSLGGVTVFEVAGLALSSAVDQVQSNGAASGTSWTSNATPTTTLASEFWVGCSDSGNPTSPSGWTNTLSSGGGGIAGWQIVSSTGTATYNSTQTSSPYGACVATLKSFVPSLAKPLAGLNQAVNRSAVW